MAALPSYADLPVRAGAPPGSSWGVWGDDDVLGTLNLLTPERTLAAARSVRRGAVFPLNLEMELPAPPLFKRAAFRHEVTGPGGISKDDLLHDWNTQSSTQWDGFRHVRHLLHGHYNGLDDERHGVHHWSRRGIAGRGVLVDVASWRAAQGRPIRAGEADPITAADLVATLAAQATTVTEGDILLVRTGWLQWYRSLDAAARVERASVTVSPACGLDPAQATAALLWDLHVSAVAADNPGLELMPFGGISDPKEMMAAFRDPERAEDTFAHFRILALLGIPIGEFWDLDALAADCAADGVYTCFLTATPLNLEGGVGSPANAVAVK
jgi:hypothetical protein